MSREIFKLLGTPTIEQWPRQTFKNLQVCLRISQSPSRSVHCIASIIGSKLHTFRLLFVVPRKCVFDIIFVIPQDFLALKNLLLDKTKIQWRKGSILMPSNRDSISILHSAKMLRTPMFLIFVSSGFERFRGEEEFVKALQVADTGF